MLNKKIFIIFLFCLIFLLILIAFIINFFKKNNNKIENGQLVYKLISSKIENNTATIEFSVKMISGKNIDPITTVRLLEENNLILYPLNGYKKIKMSKEEEKKFSFSFHFPNTQKGQLEIISGTGQRQLLDLDFPEVAKREKTVKIEDISLDVKEGLIINDKEKYSVNNYHFLILDNLIYIVVNITLENISSEQTISLNRDNFFIIDNKGKKIKQSENILNKSNFTKYIYITPGKKEITDIYFLIDKENKEFFLYLNSNKIFKINKANTI